LHQGTYTGTQDWLKGWLKKLRYGCLFLRTDSVQQRLNFIEDFYSIDKPKTFDKIRDVEYLERQCHAMYFKKIEFSHWLMKQKGLNMPFT
jgi:hypothetical protein